MRIVPWLFGTGLASVWAITTFSCGTTPNIGTNLTVTFSAATTGTGGAGGDGGIHTGGMGGMGTGGTGMGGMAVTSSSQSSSMASSGTGVVPPVETPVHGCLLGLAVDLTKAGPSVAFAFSTATKRFTVTQSGVALELSYPMCLKLTVNQKLYLAGSGVKGDPMLVGGLVDSDEVGNYDKKSPLQPTCYTASGSFDPNSAPACYTGGIWPCGANGVSTAAQCVEASQKAFTVQVYPFYDNSQKVARRGALYVVP